MTSILGAIVEVIVEAIAEGAVKGAARGVGKIGSEKRNAEMAKTKDVWFSNGYRVGAYAVWVITAVMALCSLAVAFSEDAGFALGMGVIGVFSVLMFGWLASYLMKHWKVAGAVMLDADHFVFTKWNGKQTEYAFSELKKVKYGNAGERTLHFPNGKVCLDVGVVMTERFRMALDIAIAKVQ